MKQYSIPKQIEGANFCHRIFGFNFSFGLFKKSLLLSSANQKGHPKSAHDKVNTFNLFRYIVLSTGGTGGHVFPALSLAKELKSRGYVCELVTDQRGAIYQDSEDFDRVKILNLSKAAGLLGTLRQVTDVMVNALALCFRFIHNRPQLVVGFGGYTSAPVVIAAVMLRIPIIIHEQNAVLGRVNRLMGRFARVVALGMPVTKFATHDATFVGNPVRQAFLQAQADQQSSDKFNLFVFGGSQGADLFARVVPKAIALLPEAEQQKINITHQVREAMLEQTCQAYNKTKATLSKVQPFFSDMSQQLARADLIIGRAGAMTVTEIAAVGRATIFIPLKIAMDNHQYWNVKPLVDAQAAEMIEESTLTPDLLAARLLALIKSPGHRESMAKTILQFCNRESVGKFADLIENEINK